MLENPETGITEQKLNHLDRILFGKNTIFVFKYPLMKKRLIAIREQIREENPSIEEEELYFQAKELLSQESLRNEDEEEEKEGDENGWVRVNDYSKEEIDEDLNAIDWDFAYKEVLKIENKK